MDPRLHLHVSQTTNSRIWSGPSHESGLDPGTPKFGANAGNATPTRIPTFTKHGHVAYQNAVFRMLMVHLV